MENPWILTTPARPARLNALVIHSRIPISDFIRDDLKEWDVESLKNFVGTENIPLIGSSAISRTTHRNTYWLSFTKGNILLSRDIMLLKIFWNIGMRSYIRNLVSLSFTWKASAPKKMNHLIWQLVTWHIAVTKNFTHHHMMDLL